MFEIGLIGTSTKFKPFKGPEPEIPSVELVTELVGMPLRLNFANLGRLRIFIFFMLEGEYIKLFLYI